MRAPFLFKSLIIFIAIAAPLFLRAADRTTISLNGSWQIENSKEADVIPTAWKHKVPAPGLAHSVEPPFPQVDQFDSRVLIQNRVGRASLPGALSFSTQVCRGKSVTGSGTVAHSRSPRRGVSRSCESTRRSSVQVSG